MLSNVGSCGSGDSITPEDEPSDEELQPVNSNNEINTVVGKEAFMFFI